VEIHKPKAARSWREFLVEIGTIICGILIALGLEQAVEWSHWQNEIAETRETIRNELAGDLGVLEFVRLQALVDLAQADHVVAGPRWAPELELHRLATARGLDALDLV
jgi:hypothetical protein